MSKKKTRNYRRPSHRGLLREASSAKVDGVPGPRAKHVARPAIANGECDHPPRGRRSRNNG